MSKTRTRFLADRPVLRDRLNALAVFTGIALGGVSGVEMVLGGGFDMLTPAAAYEAPAPRAWYDRPVQAGMGWLTEPYSIDRTVTQTSLSLNDSYPLDAYADDAAPGDLDGGAQDSSAPGYTPASALRTADMTMNVAPVAEQPQQPDAQSAYDDEMAAIEARMAQAPGATPSDMVMTPALARQASESASPS